MSRKNIIAANWKMNMTPSETASFLDTFLEAFNEATSVDIVLAPPFVSLAKAHERIASHPAVCLSAQNMSHETSGAFTGETNAAMLKEVGCQFVILGHSERRSLYGEDDVVINKKVHAALAAGLLPILCIGESLEERDGGQLEFVLSQQLEGSLANVDASQMGSIVIAYEPVWAIGTGKTCPTDVAESVCAFIRNWFRRRYDDPDLSENVRILYGGSVKSSNAKELFSQPNIDGGLVGGASLDASEFAKIVASA